MLPVILQAMLNMLNFPAILLAIFNLQYAGNCVAEQVSRNTFENCGKYRYPHLAILLMLPAIGLLLSMFNFPAILPAIFSYFEGEIITLQKGEINAKNLCKSTSYTDFV